MALSCLADQMTAAIMAVPQPRSRAAAQPRSREAVERVMMEAVEAKIAEIEASPPTVAELGETVH